MTTYAKVYTAKQSLEAKRLQGRPIAQAAYMAELEAEYKRLYPRRKSVDVSKLSPEVWQPIQDRHVAEHNARENANKAKIILVETWLNAHADECDMTPDAQGHDLKTSYCSNYRSQGWGMHKYAETDVKIDADMLIKRGFTARVEYQTGASMGECYTLIANCTPAQYDAILRTTDLDEWRQGCNRYAVSSRVYTGGIVPELD